VRVLLVSNYFPPDSIGGVQLYTYRLAQELHRRGVMVHVVCTGEWATGENDLNAVRTEIVDNIPVTRIHLNWTKAEAPFRFLYDNPNVFRVMQSIIEEVRPSLLHITSCEPLSASVIFAARQAGLPIVMTLAGYWFVCPRITLQHADGHICSAKVAGWECMRCLAWESKYQQMARFLSERAQNSLLTRLGRIAWVTRRRGFIGMIGDMEERRRTLRDAFSHVDVVLAISEYVREAFVDSGLLDVSKLRVHEWGLPSVAPRSKTDHVEPNDLPVRIAYFGRIAMPKGVHILIEAFRQLNGAVSLVLHGNSGGGSSSYDDYLRSLAYDDERICFWGPYNPAEAVDLMSRFDIIVVPSVWPETYNLVAREALMARRSVVASRIGALPEAVCHEQNGLLVSPNNVSELAIALQRLVDCPELREKLESGQRRIKTLEQEMEELIAIYHGLRPVV